jgi:hypothetical protein
MKTLKRDLKALIGLVEKYLIEGNQDQFLAPLRYRLTILENKYDQEKLSIVFQNQEEFEKDLLYCRSILY